MDAWMLRVHRLGLTDYGQASHFQDRLVEARLRVEIPDTLVLLEHPSTLTLGREDDGRHLLVDREALTRQEITLVTTDRGGSITWHGPGQVVGYPIIDLKRRGSDIKKYIQDLEEVLIVVLADFGLSAGRDDDHVGVWVGLDKIAAIGVRVRRGVTKHGFALNVNNDLAAFSLINPCGITDRGVTSMAKLLKRNVSLEAVRDRIEIRFAEVFGLTLDDKPAGDCSAP